MITKSLQLNNLSQKLFWFLVVLIVLLSIAYVYFVNSSIINVALRDDHEEEISVVQTQITSLVTEYLALSSLIDFDQAVLLGFAEAKDKNDFVARQSGSITLTLGHNEI